MQHQIDPKTIYLDHAAATPLSSSARAAIVASLDALYGNPSSIHELGRAARQTLSMHRAQIATSLGVDEREIVLTSGGTESDNLAILGLAHARRALGNHIIVSAIEHKAVLAAARCLEEAGFSVTYLPVDAYGTVSPSALERALRTDTILVSVMYANNEIGTIQPIADIVRVCQRWGTKGQRPLVHTDACQAIGSMPVDPRGLGVDAMTISAAKIYGPKGVGLLYVRAGVPLLPRIVGGHQEDGRRAGTENIALVAGFSVALKEAVENVSEYSTRMRALQTYFVERLRVCVPNIQFNGHPTERLPNNVHVTVPYIEGESMVLMLGEEGISCATGSACSTHDLEPSHVLSAIGQDGDLIHGSLRFTFGRTTTKEELDHTAKTLGRVVATLLRMTACTTDVYQRSYCTP